MIDRFFTTEQVANILQVHPLTILKYIKQGKLKGVKIGRVYRIPESNVKNFLDERITHESGSHSKSKIEPKTGNKGKAKEGGEDETYYII